MVLVDALSKTACGGLGPASSNGSRQIQGIEDPVDPMGLRYRAPAILVESNSRRSEQLRQLALEGSDPCAQDFNAVRIRQRIGFQWLRPRCSSRLPNGLVLTRAARRHDTTDAREPAGRREPAAGRRVQHLLGGIECPLQLRHTWRPTTPVQPAPLGAENMDQRVPY